MNYEIVTGKDHATRIEYATLASAREALDDKRHGDYCHINMQVKFDEAVQIVKSIRTRKVQLYVGAAQFAHSQSADDRANGKGFRASANVTVTRGALLRFMDNAYTERLRERCLIELSLYTNCLFVGSTAL